MKQNKAKKIGLLIFIILTLYLLFVPMEQLTIHTEDSKMYAKDSVYDSIVLTQTWKQKSHAEGIVFYVGTYMKVLEKGTIHAVIKDKNNKIILDKNIKLKTVVDSAPYYLKIPVQKNKEYTISLETKNVQKDAPITFYFQDLKEKEQPVSINQIKQDEKLYLASYTYEKSYFNIWCIFFFGAILLLYYTLQTENSKKEKNYEK